MLVVTVRSTESLRNIGLIEDVVKPLQIRLVSVGFLAAVRGERGLATGAVTKKVDLIPVYARRIVAYL